jgi:hypothetical protein
MIQVRRFDPADLALLEVQPNQAQSLCRLQDKTAIVQGLGLPFAATIWTPYGVPVACAGILPNHVAWAYLAADMRKWMIPTVRAGERVFAEYIRVVGPAWATIDETQPNRVRLARALGFAPDGERWVRR